MELSGLLEDALAVPDGQDDGDDGSDAEAALRAGYDVRHGLIGAGVYASHGYERSHVDGVENTLKLLWAYTTE